MSLPPGIALFDVTPTATEQSLAGIRPDPFDAGKVGLFLGTHVEEIQNVITRVKSPRLGHVSPFPLCVICLLGFDGCELVP